MEQTDRHAVLLLPQSMRNLFDWGMSLDAIHTLMEELGGRVLYVPQIVRLDGHITKLIGTQEAEILTSAAGGQHVCIPLGHVSSVRARHEAIRKGYDNGKPIKDLVRDYRISERQIWTILGSSD
ncbi:MAG: Mor transcription activator family protein [Deferrisomatales bacterium]|nr:Mor transcription activator family protein [Deferrisomatales bacterium]